MTTDRYSKPAGSGPGRPVSRAIDLFSGIGGMTLGLTQAGFNVVAAVEVDPLSVECYKANHPEVRVWDQDIRNVDADEMRRSLGLRRQQLGLLAACPPCQGFSSMRTLNGARQVRDPRNDLVTEFSRFVRAFLPKMAILENVVGLAKDTTFADVRQKLSALGYKHDFRILNAADHGVAQRRRRLFLLATRTGKVEFPIPTTSRVNVRQVIGNLESPDSTKDSLHQVHERRTERIMALIRDIPKDGGSRAALTKERQLGCHQRTQGFHDVYGRIAWDGVAPTITSGCVNPSKGRFLHPTEDRTITLREAALLQGFSEDYQFPADRGKFPVARLIGNAVPPILIQRVATALASSSRRRA